MSDKSSDNSPETKSVDERKPRRPLTTTVEFISDFDILEAKGINVSEGGLAFEIEGGLPFEMRISKKGDLQNYRGELVWMKRLPSGGYRMGFKFSEKEKGPTF